MLVLIHLKSCFVPRSEIEEQWKQQLVRTVSKRPRTEKAKQESEEFVEETTKQLREVLSALLKEEDPED